MNDTAPKGFDISSMAMNGQAFESPWHESARSEVKVLILLVLKERENSAGFMLNDGWRT